MSSSKEGQPSPASGELLGHMSYLIKPTVSFPSHHWSCEPVVSRSGSLQLPKAQSPLPTYPQNPSAPLAPDPRRYVGSPTYVCRITSPPSATPHQLAKVTLLPSSWLPRNPARSGKYKPRTRGEGSTGGSFSLSMLSCTVSLDVVVPNT